MVARLVFLTGSRAGTAFDLPEANVTVGRGAGKTITFSPNEVLVSSEHATLLYRDGTYFVRDDGSRNGTFVNAERVTGEVELKHGDLVQFGAGGPGGRLIFSDPAEALPTLDPHELARASELLERTASPQASGVGTDSGPNKLTTTREMVAVAVQRGKLTRRALLVVAAVAVAAIAAVFLWQQRSKAGLDRALADLSALLASERESRSALEADLESMQLQAESLRAVVAREQRRVARDPRIDPDAIRELSQGVALLVFTYGYAEQGGDRLLRYELDGQGRVRFEPGPRGQPIPSLTFGGPGQPVQRQGTATGFLVDTSGLLLTNRHVAEPWARDEQLDLMQARGLNVAGRFVDLTAYFPPGGEPYRVIVEGVSAEADVAVLRAVGAKMRSPVLPLATTAELPRPGDQLVLISYPTGLHNLLFRETGERRQQILEASGDDARSLAKELARRQLIQPLVTNGSISDNTGTEVIHTAATTVGGSGGPLIDLRHQVVAIHYASVRSPRPGDPFQTQRGVPIRFAWEVLPLKLRRELGREP